MLPVLPSGQRGPLLILLHWLGGGAQTWSEAAARLADRGVRCVAIDLPGFGHASGQTGYDLTAMSDAVIETIRGLHEPGTNWFIAGHSMGGKVAAIIARRALDEAPGLDNLIGLIFVSASPPSPEPIRDSMREQMLASLGHASGDPDKDRKHAAQFINDNTGKLPLPEAVRDRAIKGVLGMNRTAFRHWLEYGSKEDWSDRVGILDLPSVVLAGSKDEALGPEAQREYLLPHLPQAELITLEATGHLAPLERPAELTEHLTRFLAATGATLSTDPTQPGPAFTYLLQSNRVSPKTRAVMQDRLAQAQSWSATPKALTTAEFHTLRSFVERVIPAAGFDIAALLDEQLANDPGDGWRFATLPPDLEAWQRGLLSLDRAAHAAHAVSFLALHPPQQDAILQQATEGKFSPGLLQVIHLAPAPHPYSAAEMKLWFEDVCAACTRLYIADPRTMERIGFTGFADDLGFTQIQLGQREEFER